MQHPFSLSISKLLAIATLIVSFAGCKSDIESEIIVPIDPYAAEKAKQWKYSETGSDRASFLINGVHKNISQIRNNIDGFSEFSIMIDPMRNVKDIDNIDYQLALVLTPELGKLVEATFRVPGSPSVVYSDTTCFIPFKIGKESGYAVLAGIRDNVLPALNINRSEGIKTSDGYGWGWLKVTVVKGLIPNTRKVVYAGEFEVHIGYNGDSLHFTNGWFDVNVAR